MFAPISAISALLFFASTLSNGIRIGALSGTGDSVEIVAGYTSGGLSDLTSTAAGKSLLLDAYAVGGKIEFISEFDRTALRLTVPQWSAALVTGTCRLLQRNPRSEGPRDRPPRRGFSRQSRRGGPSALLVPAGAPSDYATEDAFVLSSVPLAPAVRDALAALPKRASAKRANEVTDRLPAERTLRFKSDLATGGVVFAAPAPAR